MARYRLLGLLLLLALSVAERLPAQVPAEAGRAATPTATPADYEIGPQDVLKVTVYGHPDLTQTVLVQADGTFTFPLLGSVKGDAMTTRQLGQKLTKLLASGYVRNPQVTVTVEQYHSKSVFVVGEIAKPGTYPVSGRLNLVEVLALAGPMTANAGAEVIIVRPPAGTAVAGPVLPPDLEGAEPAEGQPEAEVFRVNVRDLQTGALANNIELQSQDTVFVPLAPKVFVSGEVRTPGAYAWFPGMTARQLISMAGGLTPEGSDGRLKVVRESEGKPRESGIKLDEAIKAGDSLVVRRRLF